MNPTGWSKTWRIGLAVAVAVIIVALNVLSREEIRSGKVGLSHLTPEAAPSLISVDQARSESKPQLTHASLKAGKEESSSHSVVPDGAWRDFQKSFGENLAVEFLPDGRVASIHGKPGEGIPASNDFRPNDPQRAIQRARQILEAAKPLLGVDEKSPLENPVAQEDPVSAQVEFQQTWNGVPVSPAGGVTINLGPQGELLGLDSSYVPGVHPDNELRLSVDELRPRALAAAMSTGADAGSASRGTPRIEGGNPVIWISSTMPPVEARYAYVFSVRGIEIVLDAATGEVLSRRDHSQR